MALETPRRVLEAEVERHRQGVYRHILGMVGNPADAEDLTQEALLRAHRQLGELQAPAALGAWLHRIASNVACDFLRPAARRAEEETRAEGREPASEAAGAEQLTDLAAMSACGRELLELLPRRYRTVLLLHDLRGLSSAEIAEALGCTEGAVKIRLHRARARFRTLLEAGCEMYRDERGVLLGAPRAARDRP
jgi:RNA polymerase sigma-70 factor (ECF subfamily)